VDPLPLSVVIPAHRCERWVATAVRSARDQAPPPAEVIVVVDGPGDETAARAREAGATVIELDSQSGANAARNAGLRAATREWVAFLDCDDEFLPGHLAAMAAARDAHVLVATAALAWGDDPAAHRIYGWAGPGRKVMRGPADVALPENKVTASSVMVRREIALAAGGFDPAVKLAEELDLWVRLLEHGTGVALPEATVLYRQHAGQASATRADVWDAHHALFERYGDRPWCTRAIVRRHEGVMAWDRARSDMARGAPRLPTLLRLAAAAAHPQRALGIAQLLRNRVAVRRLTARYAPRAGQPTPPD
jgi:glycosyltransferase involved in cell wall biosynthesis